MEELIIQQSKRHARLNEFIKSVGNTVTLGRGFHNDVILSDHFIAAEQLRFDYEDGQWVLKLLDQTNPVLVNNKSITDASVVINSGDELTVGRTHLTLILSNHPVERTRKLLISNWMYHRNLHYIIPIIMLLLSTILAVFTEYQEATSKIRWGLFVASGLGYVVMLLFWVSIWSMVGRILRHKPNFMAQLFYTAFFLAVLNMGMLFYGYTTYATSSEILGLILESGFLLLILGMMLKYNLLFSTELKHCNRVAFSAVALTMLFTFSIMNLGQKEFNSHPDYSNSVKPPAAKWSKDIILHDYMKTVDSQFDELESSLKE